MYQLPPVNWLRAFEASARRESFTAAADELARTPKSVSTQVRALEAELGFALFERMRHGLRLTDMGRAYLPAVRKAFEDLSATTAGLFGPKGTPTITIRATIAFAVLWLTPRLPAFRAAYPSIDVHLTTSVWTDALPPDDLDLEIRLGDGHWPGYRTEQLTREAAVPVCSKYTQAALGSPQSAHDLIGSDLIQIMSQENLWMRFFRNAGIDDPLPDYGITVDTALGAIELACAGQGHAILLSSFAEAEAARTRLAILDDLTMPLEGAQSGHYLLIPDSDEQTRPEVMLFREWLTQAASA
ncbi:MAG: LysR substrate-binding domain-containing protein [Alphaproteobacteria bacterium]|jgi:LysR family transcriptional regulator, glycine cleavage system transcriptional activator|nr:LysR family transcriptional regulator [Rhodospirillaceae bacterium]MBT6205120.1 LysR family transcriptional regulator [Rhodospirillaceae bacterium]MBT7649278.1 LysR family transcriptional regulator [Rhodospirillaceae bacterium]MDG2479696.1 LysR substrate-binding domain-containing protein [Alphaproteobacteria bacterium]